MNSLCLGCKVKVDCQRTFGKFWNIKSSDGYGCNYPIKKVEMPEKRPVKKLWEDNLI